MNQIELFTSFTTGSSYCGSIFFSNPGSSLNLQDKMTSKHDYFLKVSLEKINGKMSQAGGWVG